MGLGLAMRIEVVENELTCPNVGLKTHRQRETVGGGPPPGRFFDLDFHCLSV